MVCRFGADLLTEGDHDHQVGGGEKLGIDVGRANQRQGAVEGEPGNRRRGEPAASAGGAVGLGIDGRDFMLRRQQGGQGGKAELSAAGKEDAHGKNFERSKAPRPRGRG